MQISDALQHMITQFKDAGIDNPVLDAEVILSNILNIDRYKLITEKGIFIDEEKEIIIEKSIKKRIKGIPVAYITGKKEFYSLEFNVNSNVLIPRPETELLVDLTIFHAKQNGAVLDLGTGSGAIAVSVKHNRHDLNVYASDISEKALRVAKRNANRLLKRNAIKLYRGDLFSPFTESVFNVIVANPPYIDPETRCSLQRDILFEPEIALFADNGGRDFINRIVLEGGDYIDEKGMIIMEIGDDMEDFIKELVEETDFSVSIMSDYAGLPRVAVLRR